MTQYPYQNTSFGGVWSGLRHGDLRLVNLLLIILTIFLFLSYLVVNNRTATDGFTIRSLEHRVAALEEQKRQLDLQMLDRQAMDSVETRAKELGFVPVSQVDYLVSGTGPVAVR